MEHIRSAMADALREKCVPSLVSNYLLSALDYLMVKLEQTAEMRGAQSHTESKIMITGIIESLLDVALQSARIVEWSDEVLYVLDQLREMIALQQGMALVYDYQQTQEENELQYLGQTHVVEAGEFQLSMLTRFKPDLYNRYILILNDLITQHQKFKDDSLFAIAAQGVRIGRNACILANILYSTLDMDEKATKMRMLQCHFSVHIMIKPVVLHQLPVHKVDQDSEFRFSVWKHLQDSHGYSAQDVEFIRDYVIWVIADPFEDQGCALAITNLDVTKPFSAPSDEARIDFKYPYVILQFIEVDKPFRRCGFATYLMDYLKRMARTNKYETLCVDQCSMGDTFTFWKAMRFKKSKHVERWYEFELGNRSPLFELGV